MFLLKILEIKNTKTKKINHPKKTVNFLVFFLNLICHQAPGDLIPFQMTFQTQFPFDFLPFQMREKIKIEQTSNSVTITQ
jgi:hypothetical protein